MYIYIYRQLKSSFIKTLFESKKSKKFNVSLLTAACSHIQ